MSFQIIYSDKEIPQKIKKSLFLAGPSPREKAVIDWRIEAIKILKEKNFDGTVFIPVPEGRFHGEDDSVDWTYDNQVEWECRARNASDIILFWVARDIKGGMPAFTTNVEFGEDLHSGKILYGRPDNAEKCKYLDKRIAEVDVVYNQLDVLIQKAIDQLGNGALRSGGEVFIPLFIWNSEQFQSWYLQLKKNGNRIDDARVEHFLRLKNGYLFSFVLWVNIWIESEQRNKDNEFVFSRKDISTIIPFYRNKVDGETYIVLVKEFRSIVKNEKGIVYELPGGSHAKPGEDPKVNASDELEEETGLKINNLERLKFVGERQLCATLSSHSAFVYKVELTEEEFNKLQNDLKNNRTFGVIEEGEKTYLEIVTLKNMFKYPLDFSMIGMIYLAVKD